MKRARLDDDTLIIGPLPWSRKRQPILWNDNSPRWNRDTVRDTQYCKCTYIYKDPETHHIHCYCFDESRIYTARSSGKGLKASEMCKPIQHGDYMLYGGDVFIIDFKAYTDDTFYLYWLGTEESLRKQLPSPNNSIFRWIPDGIEVLFNQDMFKNQQERNTYRDMCYTFVHCLLTRLGFYRDLRQMIACMVFETKSHIQG